LRHNWALRHCYTGTLPATAGEMPKPITLLVQLRPPLSQARAWLVPVSDVARTVSYKGGPVFPAEWPFWAVPANSAIASLKGSRQKRGLAKKLVSVRGGTATESCSRCRDGHPGRGGLPHQGDSTSFLILHSSFCIPPWCWSPARPGRELVAGLLDGLGVEVHAVEVVWRIWRSRSKRCAGRGVLPPGVLRLTCFRPALPSSMARNRPRKSCQSGADCRVAVLEGGGLQNAIATEESSITSSDMACRWHVEVASTQWGGPWRSPRR